jgi:hypothetical protein
VTPGSNVENDEELLVKNQTSVKGGASPELQPKIDSTSKGNSRQQPPAGASTSAAKFTADTLSQGGASRKIVPASEKGGHN